MALTQVGWQLVEGVRSLRNFLAMLEEAAAGCRIPVKRVVSWDSIGLQLDRKFWVGLSYTAPTEVRFQTEGCSIDPTAAAGLGVGTMLVKSGVPGGLIWRHAVDLKAEEVHFFARSKVGQMRWLEAFLRECLALARSIETAEQPPIPEESEEE